ncbi:MAG: ribonuclease H-like domain-containing protein, partial [Methanomassiliicoccales archaeon]|nr:ribonuclease H-like domain-containing protein [Methanomassiliicoccales archaeon]
LLPSREHWRVYDEVKRDAACLDIETDGLGAGARVTVVGIYRNGECTTLVRGQDLTRENLAAALQGSRLLITFNGSSFDLPILEREYPFLIPRVPHFDLRHGCARVGLRGGLKSIEKQMGMHRGQELEYVTGEQAVYLWYAWERRGNLNALNLLKRYNEEDTANLAPIAERINQMLTEQTLRMDGTDG